MPGTHWSKVPAIPAEEGPKGLSVRWVISAEHGARDFYVRVFEMAAGGQSPLHAHREEHGVFVLEGRGRALAEKGWFDLGPGDVLFIPSRTVHQIRNSGSECLRFICVVSAKGRALEAER